LSQLFQPFDEYSFNFYGIPSRTEELTSRVESAKIKSVLKEIEKPFDESKLVTREKGLKYLTDVVDFVLATNMISVGIDISRLNIMVLNGMPKNIAEYIQASSRVGRKTKGLAITLLDPNRAREKSYFEHFINFHSAFYKCVEPISITPFTENTIDKMLTTAFVTYIRNKIPAMAKDDAARYFEKEKAQEFIDFIKIRFGDDPDIISYFINSINELIEDWQNRASLGSKLTYKSLLKRPTERQDDGVDWATMQSMREIDTDTFVEIKSVY
jgi:superfamily II DNA/RNA helicase